MKSQNSETSAARKVAPVYGVWDGEFMIDAPIKTVWRHILNYPSWQNYSLVKHISGTPGGEGEVVMLGKDEKGFEFPPYFATTIKIDPERRMIWKTYPQKGTQQVDFFGIVQFMISEVEGKTRFRYHTIYEFEVPYSDPSELDAYHRQQDENFTTLFGLIFPKLRALCETGR